jgi:hypothetical protein
MLSLGGNTQPTAYPLNSDARSNADQPVNQPGFATLCRTETGSAAKANVPSSA